MSDNKHISSVIYHNFLLHLLVTAEDGELLIMQLPDVMPGDRPTQEDTDRKTLIKKHPQSQKYVILSEDVDPILIYCRRQWTSI